jgi:hypothetical protein
MKYCKFVLRNYSMLKSRMFSQGRPWPSGHVLESIRKFAGTPYITNMVESRIMLNVWAEKLVIHVLFSQIILDIPGVPNETSATKNVSTKSLSGDSDPIEDSFPTLLSILEKQMASDLSQNPGIFLQILERGHVPKRAFSLVRHGQMLLQLLLLWVGGRLLQPLPQLRGSRKCRPSVQWDFIGSSQHRGKKQRQIDEQKLEMLHLNWTVGRLDQ